MILVICIPEAKQIGRQVLFIRRIYSKWTFFPLRFIVALFNVSYFIWCGYCYVKFVFFPLYLSLSLSHFSDFSARKERRNSSVYNIPLFNFSIQSNKINQTCLERPFLIVARTVSSREAITTSAIVNETRSRREFLTGVIRYRPDSFQLFFFLEDRI